MKKLFNKFLQFIGIFALLALINLSVIVSVAKAERLSVTFDDGFLSTYEYALPILSSRNIPATIYVTSGFINDGKTDDGFAAMTWPQVQSLQNDYGWEIGNHSNTHPLLSTLTSEQIAQEFNASNDIFASYSLAISNFASPYGDYDNKVLVEGLKFFESHRGYADRDAFNIYPYNKGVLMVQSVETATTIAQVKAWIDQAIANDQWLILVVHEVLPTLKP